MSKYLVISITAKKDVELHEIEVPDDEMDAIAYLTIRTKPPYNGKCLIVDTQHIRTFRLNCNIVETQT